VRDASKYEKHISCISRLSTEGSNEEQCPYKLEKKDANSLPTSSGVIAIDPSTRFIVLGGSRRRG
jgi:hypothetical protein